MNQWVLCYRITLKKVQGSGSAQYKWIKSNDEILDEFLNWS